MSLLSVPNPSKILLSVVIGLLAVAPQLAEDSLVWNGYDFRKVDKRIATFSARETLSWLHSIKM
ncbi:MAG: hypothetical protein ABSD46_08025 [Bacteroidota bacterium]